MTVNKQLATSAAHDVLEQLRNGVPGCGNDQPHYEADSASVNRIVVTDPSARVARWREQHHRHDCEILKNQNPDGRTAVDRIAVALLGQRFQHDCGAAEAKKKSPKTPCCHVIPTDIAAKRPPVRCT